MPILEVDRAKSVIVLKRGKGKGFSGLENSLFFKDVTGMLYGDAKESLTHLAQAVYKRESTRMGRVRSPQPAQKSD